MCVCVCSHARVTLSELSQTAQIPFQIPLDFFLLFIYLFMHLKNFLLFLRNPNLRPLPCHRLLLCSRRRRINRYHITTLKKRHNLFPPTLTCVYFFENIFLKIVRVGGYFNYTSLLNTPTFSVFCLFIVVFCLIFLELFIYSFQIYSFIFFVLLHPLSSLFLFLSLSLSLSPSLSLSSF